MKTMKRNEKVAFMKVKGEEKYTRIRGFTEFSMSRNPIEYSRKYVDEKNERNDVVGYSPSVRYSFDNFLGDAVHHDFYNITSLELVGDDAVRSIVIVDLTTMSNTKDAYSRDWSIIPDTEGDDENTYTFSGTLKANGDIILGTATSDDNWETCQFVSVYEEDL